MTREDLISAYAELLVDGMDIDILCMYAIEKMQDDLRTYTDAALEAEVRDFCPFLLDDDNAPV